MRLFSMLRTIIRFDSMCYFHRLVVEMSITAMASTQIVLLIILWINVLALVDHLRSSVAYNKLWSCLFVSMYVCLSDDNFRKP